MVYPLYPFLPDLGDKAPQNSLLSIFALKPRNNMQLIDGGFSELHTLVSKPTVNVFYMQLASPIITFSMLARASNFYLKKSLSSHAIR